MTIYTSFIFSGDDRRFVGGEKRGEEAGGAVSHIGVG